MVGFFSRPKIEIDLKQNTINDFPVRCQRCWEKAVIIGDNSKHDAKWIESNVIVRCPKGHVTTVRDVIQK